MVTRRTQSSETGRKRSSFKSGFSVHVKCCTPAGRRGPNRPNFAAVKVNVTYAPPRGGGVGKGPERPSFTPPEVVSRAAGWALRGWGRRSGRRGGPGIGSNRTESNTVPQPSSPPSRMRCERKDDQAGGSSVSPPDERPRPPRHLRGGEINETAVNRRETNREDRNFRRTTGGKRPRTACLTVRRIRLETGDRVSSHNTGKKHSMAIHRNEEARCTPVMYRQTIPI